MHRSIFLSPLILFVSSITAAQQSAAGDSARIVILSDRVGPVISESGREKYHVFTQFEGFREAVVLQFPDSSCGVWFTLVRAGEARDTVVRYSRTTILMLAEKIEHFEDMEKGNYIWGSSPPCLRYAPGSVSISRLYVPRAAGVPSGSEFSRREPALERADTSRPNRPVRHTVYSSGVLPLARAFGQIMPRYYPTFAVAFGIRSFVPDFSGLASATGAVPRMDISPIIDVLPELLLTEEIGIQADAGISPGDKCSVAALSLVLYAHPFGDPGWRPFIQG